MKASWCLIATGLRSFLLLIPEFGFGTVNAYSTYICAFSPDGLSRRAQFATPSGSMNIIYDKQGFTVSVAENIDDIQQAQRLRHDVFCTEFGAKSHADGLEVDRFDPFCDHLVLHQDGQAAPIAVTRVMQAGQAARAGGFYSEGEFDIAPLRDSGRALLEMGRTCVRAGHRGGMAMYHLWTALAAFISCNGIDVLFGTASLPGTDTGALAQPLSLLHHRHLAPEALRARSRQSHPPLLPQEQLDRRAAMVGLPAIIKAYLRLGGVVGEGAFVDHDFRCTDVLMVMDTAAMNTRQAQMYRQAK